MSVSLATSDPSPILLASLCSCLQKKKCTEHIELFLQNLLIDRLEFDTSLSKREMSYMTCHQYVRLH